MGKSANRDRAGTGRRHRLGLGRVALGATLLAALILAVTAGPAAAIVYPPVAGPAVRAAEGFELTGTVYPYGTDTTYHFEYGTSTAYGTSVPMPDGDAGSAAFSAPVSQVITGLEADTTYHYRLVSTTGVKSPAMSADRTFSTSETTLPPPSTGGGSGTTTPGTGTGTTTTESTSGGGSATVTVGGKGPKTVAKVVGSGAHALLTTPSGRTLYSLSVETHGKFVCTASSGCLSVWHPLTVAAGVTPKGPVKLGTVKRPEGALQVTFRGRPLYTFAADKKPGQDKGDGIKDVGVWHAITVAPGH